MNSGEIHNHSLFEGCRNVASQPGTDGPALLGACHYAALSTNAESELFTIALATGAAALLGALTRAVHSIPSLLERRR